MFYPPLVLCWEDPRALEDAAQIKSEEFYFIHTSLTRLATFIVSAEVGGSLRQGEDGAFGDSLFPLFKFFGSKRLCGSFLLPSLHFSFFSLFLCRQTSTPPEEEEINLHSYFLLRTKERTG